MNTLESDLPKAAGGVVQMIRDKPRLSSLPPHALEVVAWSYRYHDRTPTRDDIMRAVTALTARRRAA